MNYEEKYKNALDIARTFYEGYIIQGHNGEAGILAEIFSELKESEDERIRKAIIAYISHDQHCGVSNADMIAWLEKQDDINEISAEWSEKDEQMILSIEQIMNCASLLNIVPEKIDNIKSWLKSLKPNKQWTPNAAQLIVIKDLIEDKNTSNVNKVILQGMLREIDDAYLQGICDAKQELEKQSKQFNYESKRIN